jgi:hypothetical protein
MVDSFMASILQDCIIITCMLEVVAAPMRCSVAPAMIGAAGPAGPIKMFNTYEAAFLPSGVLCCTAAGMRLAL